MNVGTFSKVPSIIKFTNTCVINGLSYCLVELAIFGRWCGGGVIVLSIIYQLEQH